MKKINFIIFIVVLFGSVKLSAQVTLNNVKSYNGSMGASDYYTGIVTDISGNIYAAGYCTDGICSYILFDKYNSAGTKLWSKSYRSMNNGYDVAASIAKDSLGGYYIAGYSKGLTSSYDFLLIKYNDAGDTIWSRRYNGTANGDDRAVKVAVDKNNKILLAGNASESGQGINYVLIKYDANGNQIWLKKYDGTSHTDDKINDFAFDKNNDIYTASTNNYSTNFGTGFFAVTKITSSGDTVWSKSYVGSGDGTSNGIIIDDSLNVYATGSLRKSQDSICVFTIKLNSSGAEKWRDYFCGGSLHRDSGYRLAFDELGNVYVAGLLTSIVISGNPLILSDGYFIMKYTASGQRIWITAVERDRANNICNLKVINSTTIYLGYVRYFSYSNTTRSQLAKFNSNGDSVWVKTLDNQKLFSGFNSMAADNSGNILCASSANSDAALLKYNSSGNLIWERYLNSAGFSTDNAVSIGKDGQGNIYVTGLNSMDYIFIKYNSSFTQQWAVTYSDGSTRDESYSFSTVDNLGNIYLTGTTKDSLGSRYIILLKYNTLGNLEWQRKYSTVPAQSWGICMDKTGNIIIAGTNNDVNNHSALNLLKYSPAGTLLMTTSFNAPNNASIWINYIDTDYDNNILVVGNSNGAMTWKFKSNGSLIWEKYWVNTYVNILNKVKYDKKNNVYVCGFTGTSNEYDFLTIKYDSAGNQKWAKTFNGVRNREDNAVDLVLDTLGNTYVAGYAYVQTANNDRSLVTIKYDSTGNQKWLREFHFSPNGNLTPVMISKDNFNNIYIITGYYYYAPNPAGYLTIKYNPAGDFIWSYSYNSIIATNYAKSILFVNDNKFYITGRAYGTNTGYDITTLELIQTTGIKKINENIPSNYSLSQNYPNPFNPTTNIRYQIPRNSFVTLRVYDILGKEISTLVNEKLKAGEYETSFDGSSLSSGVYFYKLTSGDFTEIKKMVMIK